jgi:phage head maturation protease
MKKIIKITKEYAKKIGLDDSYVGKTVKRLETFSEAEIEDQYVIGRVSSMLPDADGDVVIPQSLDLTRYRSNPVILKNHDHNNPIGYVEDLSVDETEIIAKIKFGSTEECQDIYQLYKDKVRRGFSLGFIPIEEVQKGSRGFDELYGNLQKRYPQIFNKDSVNKIDKIITKAELIEISCVAIPNNSSTLALTVKNINTDIAQEDNSVIQTEQNLIVIKKLGESSIKIKRIGNVYDDIVKENYLKMGGF